MRIASGQAEPPARRPAKPLPSQSQQQQQRTKVGTARADQGRQQPEQRSLKAEAPKPRIESSVPRRQQPVGSAGIRQPAKPLPSKGRDSPALSPASKVATTAGRSVEPRERHRVSQAPRRTAVSESTPKQKESLEPRVRKAPERELDRFGVHVAGSSKRDPVNRTAARSEPPQRARVETMQRSNGRREEQADRRPRPRSPVSSQSQRVTSRDRNAPASTRSGMAANVGSSNRQRDRSPRRKLSPPAARRCNVVARQPAHKRRGGYDDESEYDSLDDFIVDDDEEGGSVYCAGTVREIMGVRYRDVNDDDDDDDMEVSTRQLMMEERRSARLGRQEDEEEERRLEEEERARARRRREKYD
ncbi:hypothetical protein GGF42_003063 [Coemansia sp. RSA 2424]|nr:hypothetical protein GGF42_003063 [Coemansia sp. RSA 2424]